LASTYGLSEQYRYLKSSIAKFVTGITISFLWKYETDYLFCAVLNTEFDYFWFWDECTTAGDELENLAKEVGFTSAGCYEIAGGLMGYLVITR
jgi:hypothetical protein